MQLKDYKSNQEVSLEVHSVVLETGIPYHFRACIRKHWIFSFKIFKYLFLILLQHVLLSFLEPPTYWRYQFIFRRRLASEKSISGRPYCKDIKLSKVCTVNTFITFLLRLWYHLNSTFELCIHCKYTILIYRNSIKFFCYKKIKGKH